jgi:hypothetical protein
VHGRRRDHVGVDTSTDKIEDAYAILNGMTIDHGLGLGLGLHTCAGARSGRMRA